MSEWTIVPDYLEPPRLRTFHEQASPLVMLFPTRRSKPYNLERWQKFYDTALAADPCAVVVLDKTKDRSATEFFRMLRPPSINQSLIVQRDFFEDPLHSYSAITTNDEHFILQLHDDDDWVGVPQLPGGFRGQAVFPVHVGRDEDGSLGHLERFFGATRGDVWAQFMRYCSLFDQTSATMDQTLTLWLSSFPDADFLSNYRYLYDNSNWSTWEQISDANTELTRTIGWGPLSGPSAMQWTYLFDSLASLVYLAPLVAQRTVQLLTEQLLRQPPPFGVGLSARVLRVLPRRLGFGVMRTRGSGRGPGRISASVGAALNQYGSIPSELRWVEAGTKNVALSTILGDLLPSLRLLEEPTMDKRRTVWREGISQLEEAIHS